LERGWSGVESDFNRPAVPEKSAERNVDSLLCRIKPIRAEKGVVAGFASHAHSPASSWVSWEWRSGNGQKGTIAEVKPRTEPFQRSVASRTNDLCEALCWSIRPERCQRASIGATRFMQTASSAWPACGKLREAKAEAGKMVVARFDGFGGHDPTFTASARLSAALPAADWRGLRQP
jgi:hypothetical protein